MQLNKKALQLFAALWILIFHLWIPLTQTQTEQYLIKLGYIGVDLFFFLAAYSLADKDLKYAGFVKNRFSQIYVRFIIFVAIAAIYGSWQLIRVPKVLTGFELLTNGGGSFLWFIPAIMAFYLVYPLLLKCKWKYLPLVVLAVWFVFSIVSEKVFHYTDVFIFTNRIPVLVAGYLCKKYKIPKYIPPVLLVAGPVILYFWGFTKKLNVPFRDIYFVLGVPLVIGFCWLSKFIPKNKVVDFLGSVSLELYAFQMIFGPKLATDFYKMTESKWLTNLLTIVVTFAISIAFSQLYTRIYGLLKKKKKPQIAESK